MVTLWPWKAEDTSPASFEKILAALATKISNYQIHLEILQSNLRRYRALWTLYACSLYFIGLVVLVLVVGRKNWTIWEGTAIAGYPVLIYLGRVILASYYNYRIDTITQRLEEQQTIRFKTLEKLKAATEYNTTQQLLEKYGNAISLPRTPSPLKTVRPENKEPAKTYLNPPSTANIPRHEQVSGQNPASQLRDRKALGHNSPSELPAFGKSASTALPGPPEFAPNAFSSPFENVSFNENAVGGHWYDRLLDLLLGEDETLPKNRTVLICQSCRLINGQAPPGIRNLASLGSWRCQGCNSMNGEKEEVVMEIHKLRNSGQELDIASPKRTDKKETNNIVDVVEPLDIENEN